MMYEHEFIDFIPMPVFICDKSKIYDRNKACSDILKRDAEEVDECLKVFKDDDYKRIIKSLDLTIASGKPELIEHAKLELNGEVYDVSVHFDCIHTESESRVMVTLKNPNASMSLSHADCSKHKLINQEKLAGIGHLAAGVAHEIFNPLGYIKSNFDTLNQYFRDLNSIVAEFRSLAYDHCDLSMVERMNEVKSEIDIDFVMEDIQDLFADVDEGMDRVLNIVNGLKRFAHECDEAIEYDLNEGVKSTLMISRNEFKYDADLDVKYGDIPLVNAHSSKINQVILGMIVNAVYAIKEKHNGDMGHLSIETYSDKKYVCCKISDDGAGIEKEKLPDIFNPFYTTKPEGVGTGLGLSIAWDIVVEQHGGLLKAESEIGVGTSFTIMLPIASELG